MTLNIRNAKRKDAPVIVELIRDLAAYERAPNDAKATVKDIETALFSSNPKAFSFIAEWNDEICGFAVYFFNFSTWTGRHGIYLEDLFVRENFRGKGIGKALLASLAKAAIDNNCARLEWSVLDWNTPAIEFYKSLGATAMDEWTVYRVTGPALEDLAATTL
ncbi:MAG: GNAT family N-acetyltransferase [Parvularculaceae bacterium]